MSYFETNYSRINLPIITDDSIGLRNSQLGAIHAIGSHFTIHEKDPAMVIMPTGSGKTAVLILSAYLLRAKRILVISSSVLVRGQIENEFNTLRTLKKCNVFHSELTTPKVKEVKSPIRNIEDWEGLREFDVVIGIPNSLNTGITSDLSPPMDLFDLVLVDEAHHVPATSWKNTVKSFENAKRIYFTATPFRRDRMEIQGRMAYSYPLSKAYDDGIFGNIGYYPVVVGTQTVDLAIAKQAETTFNMDRSAGLKHYLMVRTDTKAHAKELDVIYKSNTGLNLRRIDSSKSYGYIQRTIKNLKDGILDGIICVSMLGEGFDFPNLKIAAVHRPHKSLAVTLQFIGRFARTNASDIGEAKFIAIPSDIQIGRRELYEEGAIWNDIIKDISEEAILEEDLIKEVLDTFDLTSSISNENDPLSFYNLTPYSHVKIYRVGGFDMNADLIISGHEIIHKGKSEENSTLIFITKKTLRPKWINSDQIVDENHFLFVIHYNESNGLLFINSTIKTEQFYKDTVEDFSDGGYEKISKSEINRVLADLTKTEFFNIGMENRSPNSGESYRTIAGQNAENAIRKSHGRLYANGHIFGKALSNGESITIGYSTGGKVWSNAYEKIPKFIEWCKILGDKIVSNKVVQTNTGLDDLSIGVRVDEFPSPVVTSTWNGASFDSPPFLIMIDLETGEAIGTYQLLDFDIELMGHDADLKELNFDIHFNDINIPLTYNFADYYNYREDLEFDFGIEDRGVSQPLIDYLNENPLHLFLHDFCTIINHDYHKSPEEGDLYFNPSRIIGIDWGIYNTDITKEFYEENEAKNDNGGRSSIHESLEIIIRANNPDVLIYDHGPGEVADHISVIDDPNNVVVELFHVKGSGGEQAGDRVGDIYEVCMQAVKSQLWTINSHGFLDKIKRRVFEKSDKFLISDLTNLERILNQGKRMKFVFTIVQPGISQSTLSEKLSTILAAADDAIINNGHDALKVIGS